jgi:hypothetical protein
MYNAPDINVPVSGTWQGTGFEGGPKVFTRNIRIADADASGSGDWAWAASPPTNNAGMAALIDGEEVVGGFLPRNATLEAFGTETTISTEVTDTSKLQMTWSFKDNMVIQPIGTQPPVVYGWTIDALNHLPTKITILDTQACNASTQASTITIEEVV